MQTLNYYYIWAQLSQIIPVFYDHLILLLNQYKIRWFHSLHSTEYINARTRLGENCHWMSGKKEPWRIKVSAPGMWSGLCTTLSHPSSFNSQIALTKWNQLFYLIYTYKSFFLYWRGLKLTRDLVFSCSRLSCSFSGFYFSLPKHIV